MYFYLFNPTARCGFRKIHGYAADEFPRRWKGRQKRFSRRCERRKSRYNTEFSFAQDPRPIGEDTDRRIDHGIQVRILR